MQFSETIGKISEALAKAQGEMKPAVFDSINPHFRSKYASLASITEACREALAKNNLAVVQGTSVEADKVIISTALLHSSGEWIRDQLSMNIAKDGPQAIGSAITYGRRYSLASMVGIVSEQDDDAETAEREKPESETGKTIQLNKKSGGSVKNDKPVSLVKPAVAAKNEGPVVEKPAVPNKTQISARVGKIRSIFNLSAKLGHTPDQMRGEIGKLVDKPDGIRESADIPDNKLDDIIAAFTAQLELLQDQKEKVAA